jgi:Flp pilus assembly protein TadD
MNRKQRRQEMRSVRRARRRGDSLDLGVIDLFQRGVVDHQAGRLLEAQAAYRQILTIDPAHADAHNNLGVALRDLGRLAEAEASYREALRLRPNYPEAYSNLGSALRDLGRLAEAEASCREALRLRPNYPEAHNNVGAALGDLGRPAEAEASYREALRLRTNYPEAHNNLGNALRDLGRLAEAEASYREALRLRPNYPEAHSNLGSALRDLGRLAEAEMSYREALRLRPNYPEAHNNLGNALLLAGRFEEGWKEHEWRWKVKPLSSSARDFSAPLWRGEAIGDRTILVHAEQGLGDTLQFCRYAPLMVCDAGIILEVQAPLVRLLSRLPGVMEIFVRGARLPPFDLHCPLMSLPHAFGTTLDTIPVATPYLSADPVLAANWQERLVGLDGLRIGLVWAGGRWLNVPAVAAVDSRRSIALKALAPLGEVSGVSFVSLQKDAPAAQAADPPHGLTLYDFTADLHDFEDTAALIVNLDLVISVDTSVAHLAGALGKPVWLLNRFDTCWRWLLNRDDSPWYPTLRQFRQARPGDWNSAVCATRDALQRLMAGDGDQLPARRAGFRETQRTPRFSWTGNS